jgi:peptidoglycan hydrolase-like protein with peptidoglycan-binding domain
VRRAQDHPVQDHRALDRVRVKVRRTSRPVAGSSASGQYSREDVKSVQEALKQKGMNPGPIDGVMGPQTQQALRAFQRSQNIQQTGQLDSSTASALGVQLSSGGASGSSATGTGSSGAGSSGTGSSSRGSSGSSGSSSGGSSDSGSSSGAGGSSRGGSGSGSGSGAGSGTGSGAGSSSGSGGSSR